MRPLSACIITRDEEGNLGPCLDALGFCDEVLVVDSGSRDRTVALARARGARVVEADWPGMIAQKNRAVAAASHDWVLCVDADERVSRALADAIERTVLAPAVPSAAGYAVAWRTRYLGGPVRSDSGRGRWKIRLFDRRRGRWVGREPHGHVEVEGRVERLRGPLHHLTYRDVAHHVEKMNPYTDAAAREMHARGRRALPGLLYRPPAAFVRSFLVRGGFRDGVRGFVVAAQTAAYVFLKYAKLWELRHVRAEPDAGRGGSDPLARDP